MVARHCINWYDLRGYAIEDIAIEDAEAPLSGGDEKRVEIYLTHQECPEARIVMRYELMPEYGGPVLTFMTNTLEHELYYLVPAYALKCIKETCNAALKDIFKMLSWSSDRNEDKN